MTLTRLTTVAFLTPWTARERSSERKIGPYEKLSSAAANPGAGLLFQLTMKPLEGSIACGCLLAARNPCQSYCPVPTVGNDGSIPAARIGSRPHETYATCFEST